MNKILAQKILFDVCNFWQHMKYFDVPDEQYSVSGISHCLWSSCCLNFYCLCQRNGYCK